MENDSQKKILELQKHVRLSIIAGDIQQSRIFLEQLERAQRDFETTYDLT